MRVSLVYNSKSGGAAYSGKELKALLRASGYDVAHCLDKKSSWKALLKDPGDMVVVAGGDGTVGKVALAFAHRDVPIALLPTGTANNVARMLGIEAAAPEEHIAGWVHASQRNLDIGIASGPWGKSAFIEGVGFGLLASAMAQLHAQDKHSDAKRDDQAFKLYRDRLAVKALATSYRPMAMSGAVDGVGFSGEYLLLEALNIRSVGPGIELAPDAEADDGLLDLAMVPADRREDFIDYLTDRLQGVDTPAPVTVRRGRTLTLVANRHDAHIDDRLWRAAARPPAVSPDVEIKAQSHAVTVLTPRRHGDRVSRPQTEATPVMVEV
ncbi:MAG TPA: diacylglycerol kinase family protein [Vineibacter sp.]|nr:diacylglycerol kinase family protein [Vineibacter sp.]